MRKWIFIISIIIAGQLHCFAKTTDIYLTKEIVFTWDNEKYQIIENENFDNIKRNIVKYQPIIISNISNIEEIDVQVCGSESVKITSGIMAFLLLEKLKNIPWYKVFNMQFDTFILPCRIPSGLLEYISKNPNEVTRKLNAYYEE
ncbi:hypothetical protein [uncultured Winogradskyella sp.]|uniref:hypothetical protein n=1 Tax=uncultured Winogradskyella sp. TaxID=395353 RepID=UPI0026203898|nr:hypothetical protein [uncultured Winogradskyella sp.]